MKEFKGKVKKPKGGANVLTTAIISYLTMKGHKAYRVNNGAVYDPTRKSFRKNPNKLNGIPDIGGYLKKHYRGLSLFVEVKYGKDKLSPEQIEFLKEATESGCIAIVAQDIDSFIEEFENTLNQII